MNNKITIITPTITKAKTTEVLDFIKSKKELEQFVNTGQQQEADFGGSTKAEARKLNPHKDQDEKIAKELYRSLHKPLGAKYMDTVVQGTGMTLKEVIGNYWFRVPEGHYVTLEYDLFHRIKGNRDIDPAHVAHLINEFEQNGYGFNVAAVNEAGGILDGQHRLAAISYLKEIKQQNHPYIFDIIPGGGIDDIEKHNTNRDEWDWENRLQSGIDLGLDAYIKLGDIYINKYNKRFPISELIRIFLGETNVTKENFIKRKIEYNKEHFEKGIQFLDKVQTIHDTLYPEKQGKKISNSWCRVMIKLFNTPKFNYKRLYDCVTSPQTEDIYKLQKSRIQSTVVVAGHLLAEYNNKLITNRLPVKDWNGLKDIPGYSSLETLNLD